MRLDLLQRAAVHGNTAPDAHEQAAFGGVATLSTLAPGLQLSPSVFNSSARTSKGIDTDGSESAPPVPPAIQEKMLAAARRTSLSFIDRGPWVTPLQLPKHYLPGLAARPWHSVDQHYPHLKPLEELLRASAPALRKEYMALKRKHLLFPETECIHDAAAGAWKQYNVNGYWLRRDANGCSLDTPATCALLQRINDLGIPNLVVLRAGFSAVSSAAHIKPHYGMTNAQLKMHLGLIIPTDASTGLPCAAMRVYNETHAWREGDVLFFDDSFLHAVWNGCQTERVIFQLVITHPDLDVDKVTNAMGSQSGPAGTRGVASQGSSQTVTSTFAAGGEARSDATAALGCSAPLVDGTVAADVAAPPEINTVAAVVAASGTVETSATIDQQEKRRRLLEAITGH